MPTHINDARIDFNINFLISTAVGKRKKWFLRFKKLGCEMVSEIVTLIENNGFSKETLKEIVEFEEDGVKMPIGVVEAAKAKLQG